MLCVITVISVELDRPLLIACVYMSCNSYSVSRIGDEFLDVLDEVDCLSQRMPNFHVLVGGDLNADVSRDNAHSRYLLQWANQCNLSNLWQVFPSDERFTYADLYQGTFSCIDHWFVSSELECTVKHAEVLHDGTNPSKHSVIDLSLELLKDSDAVSDDHEAELPDVPSGPRILWHKSKPYVPLYQANMDMLLDSVRFNEFHVSHCGDWTCENPVHLNEIDAWLSELIRVALSADHVFPRSQQNGPRTLCGWDDSMRELKAESIFWNDAWKASGCLREGWVFEKMRASKRSYMYGVRRLKRRQRELKASKFAEAIANDSSRDFFREVKKRSHKPKPMNLINGVQNENDIAGIFKDKYSALYNSVSSNPDQLAHVKSTVDEAISVNDWSNVSINVALVSRAVQRLNAEKSDGESDFNSCHLMYGSQSYLGHVANLFQAMYTHGYLPDALLRATIISIPKDYHKSLADDSNYRGIALCSSLSKLLDVIMLMRNGNAVITSDCQFAFKKRHSTSMCTYVLKEVVNSFLLSGSPVYACFLDATKAFDRIRFDLLFSVLIKKGVSPIDVRLFLFQYLHQKCRVGWRSCSSEYFSVINGVRQGGVASPTFFCMYLDSLLEEIEEANVGCHYEGSFFGCLTYADDIALLSPTVDGLQMMLNICENFCTVSNLQFNPSKTVCMCFRRGANVSLPSVSLCGVELTWSDEVKHLGHKLCFNLSEKSEISFKRGDLAGRTNVLLSQFGNMDHIVLLKIFKAQCVHIYGCQSWNLADKHVSMYHTMYNRCVRRILKLPFRTHTAFLPRLTGSPPVVTVLLHLHKNK